jgi:hypothetical protein
MNLTLVSASAALAVKHMRELFVESIRALSGRSNGEQKVKKSERQMNGI